MKFCSLHHGTFAFSLAAFVSPFLLALQPAAADSIDLLSIDGARFESGWTLNGDNMQAARAKLLNGDYFGASGTVGRAILIHDSAATIDAALLTGIEVVFIGYLSDTSPNAFSAAELDALYTWVQGGGGILITCDSNTYDAVCSRFGFPITGFGENFATASGAGFNHPALDGPFGAVRQVATWGDFGNFSDAVDAIVLMRSDRTHHPIALARALGSGRVVALGDADMLSDNTLSDSDEIERPNDALLGNSVAWLAGAFPGGACLPDNHTLCLDDAPGDGRFRITVTYETTLGGGFAGTALATPLEIVGAEQGGLFTFFNPAVPEVLLKILNGCSDTDHYWVFFSAGTNAGFEVTIEDLVLGGEPWTYTNPDLVAAPPVQDIYALPCS